MNLIKNIINYYKNVKYYYKVNKKKSISLMWVAGTSHNLSKLSQTLFPCVLFKKMFVFLVYLIGTMHIHEHCCIKIHHVNMPELVTITTFHPQPRQVT